MERWTRRGFIKGTVQAAAGTAALGTACSRKDVSSEIGLSGSSVCAHEVVPLNGTWLFRTDAEDRGEASGWHGPRECRRRMGSGLRPLHVAGRGKDGGLHRPSLVPEGFRRAGGLAGAGRPRRVRSRLSHGRGLHQRKEGRGARRARAIRPSLSTSRASSNSAGEISSRSGPTTRSLRTCCLGATPMTGRPTGASPGRSASSSRLRSTSSMFGSTLFRTWPRARPR